jgi:hypothetical protein
MIDLTMKFDKQPTASEVVYSEILTIDEDTFLAFHQIKPKTGDMTLKIWSC